MSVTGEVERMTFLGVTLIDEAKSKISAVVKDIHGVPSGKIIRMSDAFQVEFKWSLGGPGVPILGGHFDLEVDAEYLGQEKVLAAKAVQAAAAVQNPGPPPTLDYTEKLDVPAGTIKQEGVYRITKHLHYTAPFFGLKTVAFVESEDIEFY